jgi:hypothetical protein
MTLPVKLARAHSRLPCAATVVGVAFGLAFALAACTKNGPSAPPSSSSAASVAGTTELRAATFDVADAPRVGKPQHDAVVPTISDEDPAAKEDPPRRDAHRPGGGFSGYK